MMIHEKNTLREQNLKFWLLQHVADIRDNQCFTEIIFIVAYTNTLPNVFLHLLSGVMEKTNNILGKSR